MHTAEGQRTPLAPRTLQRMTTPLRVLHFIAYPQRMAGANRSLFELITNYPSFIDPHVVVTAEGEVAAAYRTAKVRVSVLNPGGALAQFGGAATGWTVLQRGVALTRDWLPYSLRL